MKCQIPVKNGAMTRSRLRLLYRFLALALFGVAIGPAVVAAAHPVPDTLSLPRVESQRVEVVSHVGGLVTAAFPLLDGTTLVAEGPTLARLFFDGGQARPIERRDLGHGLILDMILLPNDTLVVLSEEGVSLLALQEDELPVSLDFAPGSGQMLAGQNRLIAVAARDAGLRLLRITPSDRLVTLATLALGATAEGVALSEDGQRAFIAAGTDGVLIADLSKPDAPRLVGALRAIASADAVGLAGSLLIVASGDRVLVIDPAQAQSEPVGIYAPLRAGRRIAAAGDYLYVADARDGLKIFWLAERDHPVQIYGEVDRPALDLQLDGNLLYLLGPDGLRLLDVGSPLRPVQISSMPLPGTPQSFDIGPERIFVALGEAGVGVVNIENRAAPNLIRRIPVGGPVSSVVRTSSLLYAAADEVGLALIDPNLPDGEELIGTFGLPAPAFDIAAYGQGVFVLGSGGELLSLDVEVPESPVLMSVRTPVRANPVAGQLSLSVDGRRAFLADGRGYTLLDVGSPDQVGELARYDVPAADIAALGSNLYSIGGDHLDIYDASASTRPLLVRTYQGIKRVGRMSVAGDRVFLSAAAADGPSLVVLNLATPDFPVEADSTPFAGEAYRAWTAGESLWLARGYRGLSVFRTTERGVLAPQGAFGLTPDTARLAASGDWLAAGGRDGWSLVSAGEVLAFQGDAAVLPARDLAMDGNIIAVAAGDNGVALYTIADNHDPVQVERHTGHGPTTAVALDRSYVYAVDAGGLAIYDRRYLSPVTRIALPSPALDVALHGGNAFLPMDGGRLAVVDVTDPTGGLVVRTTLETRRPLRLIAGPGQTFFYGLADNRLLRLGIDGLDRLYVESADDLLAPGSDGFFLGSRLWVLTPGSALRQYDVTGLGASEPAVVRRLGLDAVAAEVYQGMAYVAGPDGGLDVVNIVSGATEGRLLDETVNHLMRRGSLLLTSGDSLKVWDLADPARPVLLSSLPLASAGRTVTLNEDGHLLVSTDGGLVIASWDGSFLTQAGLLATDGALDNAMQVGNWAFLDRHDGGLQVVDLSIASDPRPVFTYTSAQGRFVEDMLAWGESGLLVSWSDGVELLDLTGLTAQLRLRGTPTIGTGTVHDLAFFEEGDRAALALGDEGVVILDAADPLALTITGFASTPGEAQQVALSGDTMAVADGVCGVRFFDVSDPTEPKERGYWSSSFAGDVAAGEAHNLFYVAEANQLLTLRYNDTAPSVLPPVPQQPTPDSGQDGLPLAFSLRWGPALDPCDPLVYDVYLGIGQTQELAGRTGGAPSLEIGDLQPLRTYRWQVVSTDRQGDVREGPIWQFTTAAADFTDNLPPAPPLLLERLRGNPVVPAALLAAAVGAALLGVRFWIQQRRQ